MIEAGGEKIPPQKKEEKTRKRNCKWAAVLLGTVLLAGCYSAEETAKREYPSGMLEINEIAIFCACPCEYCRKCPKCQKSPCKKAPCPERKNRPADPKKKTVR